MLTWSEAERYAVNLVQHLLTEIPKQVQDDDKTNN